MHDDSYAYADEVAEETLDSEVVVVPVGPERLGWRRAQSEV